MHLGSFACQPILGQARRFERETVEATLIEYTPIGWVYASLRQAQCERQAQHGTEMKERLGRLNRLGCGAR